MAFTDRFIKVPILVHNKQEQELTGKAQDYESWYKFLPFELAAYRPTFTIDEPDIEVTQVILKNGDTTLIELPVFEFEKAINLFVGDK